MSAPIVARAFIAQPKLIVANEPTGALDTLAAGPVLDLLDVSATAGTAIVLDSHDRSLLEAFCRVVTMRDGETIGDQ